MNELQKSILLELYKKPGVLTNINTLLINLNPEKRDLVDTIYFLENNNNLIVSDNRWRKYKVIEAGMQKEIKDCDFNFALTVEGEKLVRERYLQSKQARGGFSGNVIGDNFQNNQIIIGNGNTTVNNQKKPKNKYLKILRKYWWGLLVPVMVGLIVWLIKVKLLSL